MLTRVRNLASASISRKRQPRTQREVVFVHGEPVSDLLTRRGVECRLPAAAKEVDIVMKTPSLIERYLLIQPSVRGPIEFAIIVVVGILGSVFDWMRLPFTPYSNILGAAICVAGLLIHQRCHKDHRQALDRNEQIEALVTTGVFSKVRHPMYSSLILMYLGLAIVWGVAWMLIPAVGFSMTTVAAACGEEDYLLQKFAREYREYMRAVPRRFIPHVF